MTSSGHNTKVSVSKIPLGITNDEVALGSHLIHFWRSDEEFERGVRFLELGIADESQYCVLFGHDEANQRVLEILRKTGCDMDQLLHEGRVVVLRRESPASVTLENTVSGSLVLNAGFGTHSLAVRGNTVQHNPYCAVEGGTSAA